MTKFEAGRQGSKVETSWLDQRSRRVSLDLGSRRVVME